MPKSKHRRKLGGKAVARPGRGKPGKPLRARLDELTPDEHAPPDTSGLPLFDWGDTEDRPVVVKAGSSRARKEC